ncbi:glycosyltransferase [Pontimonas salivibrio]|uniref:Glycosyltransferase n=1 Tax=Pontimonas salivibrio TaxID=1159327 RepID=A0A2L2BSS8_9MICO|nr:glycosyltransferase [Pontimonas salivibrio]
MSKSFRFNRLAKDLLTRTGVGFFKRPSEVSLRGRPWCTVLTRFENSSFISVGPFFWFRGRFGKTSLKERSTTRGSDSSLHSDYQKQPFILSSLLNGSVKDESWYLSAVVPREISKGDFWVLGGDKNLIDGTRLRAHNYFHFLLQAVPVYLTLGRGASLLIQLRGLKNWHKSVCAHLNIPLRPASSVEVVNWDLVRSPGLYPATIAVNALRNQLRNARGGSSFLRSHQDVKQDDRPRVLIINRTEATSLHKERLLGNLVELESVLRAHVHLKVADLGTMPFREQIHLINWADVLCGPHGAGLGNMALHFQPEPPEVIELVHHSNVRWHFERLASILGFGYQRVFLREGFNGQLFVEPGELLSVIRRIWSIKSQ